MINGARARLIAPSDSGELWKRCQQISQLHLASGQRARRSNQAVKGVVHVLKQLRAEAKILNGQLVETRIPYQLQSVTSRISDVDQPVPGKLVLRAEIPVLHISRWRGTQR